MTIDQSSCLDCRYDHPYSLCPDREKRKRRLEEYIERLTKELAALKAYDREVEKGKVEAMLMPKDWVQERERARQRSEQWHLTHAGISAPVEA